MGFRFRKGIRIAPGLRLNITKHGISSLSVGGKGLTYNIGKKGTRTTGGLPGTGLSYSQYSSYDQGKEETVIDRETGEITQRPAARGSSWLMIAMVALIVGGFYFIR